MKKNIDHKQYIYVFLAMSFLLSACVFAYGFMLYKDGALAAPPITGRISFDEKLRFFHDNMPPGHVNVLAVGSSMTLNNLSSKVVTDSLGDSYINFSSWGLSIKQISFLIRFLVERYEPEMIINITGPMDFYKRAVNVDFFKTEDVDSYLDGNDTFFLYMKYFDPFYLARSSRFIKQRRAENTMYKSVKFDSKGGVALDIAKDNIVKNRWERKIYAARLGPDEYEELRDLATYLEMKNVRFIMVQSPIRDIAISDDLDAIRQHWDMIKSILNEHSFTFINLYRLQEIDDEYFIDSTHLNFSGADIFTNKLVESIQLNLNVEPR